MMYSYKANWVRVIDGDTVILNVDLGLHTFHISPFRLLGFNAPELHGLQKEEGLIAKEVLERILLSAGDLRIETHKPDKYGRWLVEIFYKNDHGTEVSVNKQMASTTFTKPQE